MSRLSRNAYNTDTNGDRQEKPGTSFDPLRLTASKAAEFQATIYPYYRAHQRKLPWRETYDPYEILVSEIMLQQTQVERVLHKYGPFISRFPGFSSLAQAPLKDVLEVWMGLGYNRRAQALQGIAERVCGEFGGRLPDSPDVLKTLPGIGEATAGALTAFAFQRPVVFIETNIRRVFLHFFFRERQSVADREIIPLVRRTLDEDNIREWYYALMDYGAMIGKTMPNPNRRSAHHHRQSRFEDSDRQIRGMILRTLLTGTSMSAQEVVEAVGKDRERVKGIIERLVREGLVGRKGNRLAIASVKPTKTL